METQKKPIGLVIKEIAEEKDIKVKALAQAKGISPQAVHDVFKRKSIGTTVLEEWATILGVSTKDILERSQGVKAEHQVKAENLFNFGDGYLMRYLEELEQSNKWLRDQIKEKDEQIKDFREMLGKPSASSTQPL